MPSASWAVASTGIKRHVGYSTLSPQGAHRAELNTNTQLQKTQCDGEESEDGNVTSSKAIGDIFWEEVTLELKEE